MTATERKAQRIIARIKAARVKVVLRQARKERANDLEGKTHRDTETPPTFGRL